MPRIDAPTVAEHTANRRRQVAEAAVAVLGEQGPAGLTPAAVAQRAGIARSSVYQYFPSTDALLGAAAQAMLEATRDRLAAAVRSADTPVAQVTAYVHQAFEDETAGHRGVMQALMSSEMPEVCRVAVREVHAQMLEPLVGALAAGGTENPRTVAALVFGLVNSAAAAARPAGDVSAFEAETLRFVLRGAGLQ